MGRLQRTWEGPKSTVRCSVFATENRYLTDHLGLLSRARRQAFPAAVSRGAEGPAPKEASENITWQNVSFAFPSRLLDYISTLH